MLRPSKINFGFPLKDMNKLGSVGRDFISFYLRPGPYPGEEKFRRASSRKKRNLERPSPGEKNFRRAFSRKKNLGGASLGKKEFGKAFSRKNFF